MGRSRFGGNAEERPTPQALERQRNEETFAILTDEQRQAWLDLVGEVVADNGTPTK